jgi:hypothetical protein
MVAAGLIVAGMRRSLVLTDEAARHPFLASLPPYVRRYGVVAMPARRFGLTAQDVRQFFLAYCAFFIALSAYFA